MEANRVGHCRSLILILDSNMLIYIAKGLIPLSSLGDILESIYKLVVPSRVIEELKSISMRGGLEGKYARKALELLNNINVEVALVDSNRADDAIVDLALKFKSECRVVVATSDRELRSRLKSLSIPTLYYRVSRGSVELEWLPL
ncbi:MAG: PIN domain-containing protein [Acidilobaceae archaeon]